MQRIKYSRFLPIAKSEIMCYDNKKVNMITEDTV